MDKNSVNTIDFEKMAKHFDAAKAEEKWNRFWSDHEIYKYDDLKPRDETFVVDTPPPTVSGSLHIGHVFSYAQTDIVVRFQRMKGKNIFYPMGWDDNGLPTERRVQNYFHVQCDPELPYEKGLKLEPADKKKRKERAKKVSRQNFIELCHEVTCEDEKAFKSLFGRVGLSVDWSLTYETINDECRHLAQYSFLDLHKKGFVYQLESPTMWDVDFQTAVAQAEVEDRSEKGAFHKIRFGVEGLNDGFTIATTRPELLPACVGVTAHPDDSRYQHLFGKRAITPLFHVPVPIFSSPLVEKEKGTGILMVCTFGDQTDIQWWRDHQLPLRQIMTKQGRLDQIEFGTDAYPSLNAPLANEFYGELVDKKLKPARELIVTQLRKIEGSACADGQSALVGEPESLDHAVKFYEKGVRPLEFVSTRQWFVNLLEHKEKLIEFGKQIQWHPEFMGVRFQNWTENLALDWCVSRQRFFGVPFPVWYPCDDLGDAVYEDPILPSLERLPVDPMVDVPDGYHEKQRNCPNGFVGERDVFDTWFTSSLTPQIGSKWVLDPRRHKNLFPADIRPQAHEIIRTWAFYTIAKAYLHEGKIPWKRALISGWILDPDRKKMGKSKGNAVVPTHLLDEYTSDGARYWAANAKLGVDTVFDEKILKVGKRLVTKIFNAGKFVLSQQADDLVIIHELDKAFLRRLSDCVNSSTEHFEKFEYSHALDVIESFFWKFFTDSYIELVKNRARGMDPLDVQGRNSAVATLRLGLNVMLRLFAPFIPFITEEVWSWVFASQTQIKSIHQCSWPSNQDFSSIDLPKDDRLFELAIEFYGVINRSKTESGASVGRDVLKLHLTLSDSRKEDFLSIKNDLFQAVKVKCEPHLNFVSEGLEEENFRVDSAEFAAKKKA